MIVKDEASNLRRIFDSVLPYISTYCICDTGSTDGTPDLIKAYFDEKGVVGEVLHHKWKDFGHNHTLASKAAFGKADFILTMDADDYFEGTPDFSQLENGTVYNVKLGCETDFYYRPLLYPGDLEAYWVGPLHEYMTWDDQTIPKDHLPGQYVVTSYRDGSRQKEDTDKLARDSGLLLQAIEDENGPIDRNTFYLANTYRDHQLYEEALKWYKKRIALKGWVEEVFISGLRAANCYDCLGEKEKAIYSYIQAANYYPIRALEALHPVMEHYRSIGLYDSAYVFGMQAFFMPSTLFVKGSKNYVDSKHCELFVTNSIYDWKYFDELSVISSWLMPTQYELSILLSQLALQSIHMQDHERDRIEKNISFLEKRIKQTDKKEIPRGILDSIKEMKAYSTI
jgi:glycosyltransferase involved in cell wall biosynthesis